MISIHWATIADRTAVFAAAVAAAFSAWTGFQVRRATDATARATEAQAKSTADAAQAAIDAARAAEASVSSAEAAQKIAETLARIEVDRRHDEMFPDVDIDFRWEQSMRTVQYNLFAYVTNRSRRDYTIEARKTWDTNSSALVGVQSLGAGQTAQLHVGDSTTRLPNGLAIDFDAVDPCPCPRSTPSGRHWARGFAVPQDKPVPANSP